MDGGFRDIYRHNDWVAENVLRFQMVAPVQDWTLDEIRLVNKRSGRIPFVLLGYTDLFLILDFESGATARVRARRSGECYLWAEAPVEGRSTHVYLTKDTCPGFEESPGVAASPGIYVEVEIGDRQFTVTAPPR
jgi:hypothetical protein